MSEILDFQAGREARIALQPRDGRRNSDWKRGWDEIEMQNQRGERPIPDGCPSCGALPCDWTQRPTVGWQTMDSAPKGEVILGLKLNGGEGSQPVICGELYDERLAGGPALIDRWAGRWARVSRWMPIPA